MKSSIFQSALEHTSVRRGLLLIASVRISLPRASRLPWPENQHVPSRTIVATTPVVISVHTYIYIYNIYKGSRRGGLGVLRGECEEVFVFELSGTHELHTINTTYQVATT